MGARVIQVIETELERRGTGTCPESPVRILRQYWSLDGVLLAEVDPYAEAMGRKHAALRAERCSCDVPTQAHAAEARRPC